MQLPPPPGDEECCYEPYIEPQSTGQVLVIYNSNVAESLEVANHYITRRGISTNNLLAIAPSNDTEISYAEYLNIKNQIRNKLTALGNRNILYIVFSYRTPYRIPNVPSDSVGYGCAVPCNRGTSLDQFVADIWDQTGVWSPFTELQPGNAYYAPSQSKANQYQPFVSLAQFRNQSASLTYSVWRLDAPSAALAKGLVDKAISAETNGIYGTAYFDKNVSGMYQHPDNTAILGADWDIYRAAEFAREAGFTVVEDNHDSVFGTAPAPLRADNAILYAGLYNYGVYNDAFTWNTGAIGFDFNSSAAQNFRAGANWSGGALTKGITVTGGAIDEPYATLVFKYDGIFRDLFQGANIGDAVLRNTPALKWRLVNIGDPLYRPLPNMTIPRASYAPNNWNMVDINAAPGSVAGIPDQHGGMTLYEDKLVVRTFGNGLYGNNDSFNFTYKSLDGDGGIIVRVSRTEHIGSDSFAGLMVRENNNPDGRFIALTISGTGLLQAYVRPSPGTFIGESNGFIRNIGTYTENPYPIYLHLKRTGNTFYGYKSTDEGITWTQVLAETMNLPNMPLIGLISVGHEGATPNKVFFDSAQTYVVRCHYMYSLNQPPQEICWGNNF